MSLIEKWKKNGRKNFHICQNLHPHQISEKCKVVNVFDGDLVESDLRKAIDEVRKETVKDPKMNDRQWAEQYLAINKVEQKIFGSDLGQNDKVTRGGANFGSAVIDGEKCESGSSLDESDSKENIVLPSEKPTDEIKEKMKSKPRG